jgi:glutaconate CoA-transferase, subunit B
VTKWTQGELIAVSASRLLQDHKVVFAGVGMPLVASVLAQRLHAPDLTVVLEGGIIGTRIEPGDLPISTNEMRAARRSAMLTDITDIFLYAQRGFFDYGFLGGAQIDQYGNVNTTVIGSLDNPKVRLPGTGGANDIISLCKEIFLVTRHERRRFVEHVDFVTSPGHLKGNDSRREAGLLFGTPSTVVTDLGLLDFEPETKRMRLVALQPGATVEQIFDNTGFGVLLADDLRELPAPSDEELAGIRKIDPDGTFVA